jgi:hypothetical protein
MIIACPNLANPEVKQEFDELISVLGEKAAYAAWALNDGNMIDRAPNGAPSILFQSLLSKNKNDRTAAIREKAEIYKKSFNSWFTKLGDEAKELFTDANGEPLTEVLDKNFSSIYDILVGKQDPVVDLNKVSSNTEYDINARRDTNSKLINAIASTHRQLKQIPKKANTTRYGGDNIYYQLRKALPKEIVKDIVKFYYEEKDRDSFLDRVEFYINNELKQSVMPKVIAAAKEKQLELSTHYDARDITA